MRKRTRARVMSFGLSPNADVRASDISSSWPNRLSLTVTHRNKSQKIQTRLVGEFWATLVLAAVTCGIACGLDLRTCAKAIAHRRAQPCAIFRAPGSGRPDLPPRSQGAGLDHSALFRFSQKRQRSAQDRNFREPFRLCRIGGSAYRRVAREALEVADRVVFVGSNSRYVEKLRQGELADRLLAFQTAFEASAYFKEHVLPDELTCPRDRCVAITSRGSCFRCPNPSFAGWSTAA
jgi:UDP-N-acetylmuramoyl-tripeptide--D-alanyl-D-alanine ligase